MTLSIILSLFLFSSDSDSTVFKATYKYDFKMFKTTNITRNKGRATLLIGDQSSTFLDAPMEERIAINSNSTLSADQRSKQLLSLNASIVQYIVHKDFQTKKTIMSEVMSKTNVGYECGLMDSEGWHIQEDTTTISGYMSQKATRSFGGREWTAWYAPEIPISDGPHKFAGLPGLITKLSSDDKEYSYQLLGFMKEKKRIFFDLSKIQMISPKRYRDIEKQKADELILSMKNNLKSFIGKKDGVSISQDEISEELRREVADYNYLEKELP